MQRLLTPADERKLEARKARWLSGKDKRSLAAFKATCLWGLGQPVPRGFVRDAVCRHGHLGLRALNVAAAEVLAEDSPERRRDGERRRHARGRVVRRARSRSPGRQDDPDPEPDHPLAVVPAAQFWRDVDRWLERHDREAVA